MKATNVLNSVAELMAETVVALQDVGQTLMRISEEIEEKEKETKA